MDINSNHPKYIFLSLLGAILPFFTVIWLVMDRTGGFFEYTLDDPYIHLAMSEQIANGGYGVNAGEYTSASSSILFPFLLAPFAGFDWHWLTPLFVGFAGLLASALLWGRFVGEIASRATPGVRLYLVVLALIGPLFLHFVGMSLIGMEHGLSVLAAMMVAYGLIRHAEGHGISWFLALGIILSPMLRFEGLAVSCFACAVLLFSGRPRWAVGLGAAALLPVGIYCFALTRLGLAPLPNSVMAKGAIVGGDTHFVSEEEETQLETLINTIKISLDSESGLALVVFSAIALVVAWIWRDLFGRIGVLLAVSASALAMSHVLLGSIGYFYRYEVYAWAYGCMISLYLLSLIWAQSERAARLTPALMIVALAVGGLHYPLQSFYVYPTGGAAIAVQQRQMGIFVDEYVKDTVAVNDLGHVVYRNPHYVLDFWGLASREALDARVAERDPNWADDLIERYDVGVIMIYDTWFEGRRNPNWIKVADLGITLPLGALGGSAVAFYAVTPEDEIKLRADLEAFAPTLPEGATMTFVR